jgi:hypothetical protein
MGNTCGLNSGENHLVGGMDRIIIDMVADETSEMPMLENFYSFPGPDETMPGCIMA